MVFSSVEFLFIFLPAFLACYTVSRRKNIVLFLGSVLFYVWGEGWYAGVLLASILINWLVGLWIVKSAKPSTAPLAIGIAANLLSLLFFKYLPFLTNDILGLGFDFANTSLRLPIGISFYTFQAISYIIDVHRRDAPAEKDILNLGTYIAMFPQLVAGPIVRYSNIAKTLHSRMLTLENVRTGVLYFSVGLAQKTLIANTMGQLADVLFAAAPSTLSASAAWGGAAAYALQIYFDFSGYSHMAIGLGLWLGFTFPENFNFPYISESITEFWRRWHISLSTWLRDYLYIPLGGNRGGSLRTYRNLWIVFLLCGLWHGAAWTFLFWGGYYGTLLILERLCLLKALAKLPKPLRILYVLLCALIGWVFFRVERIQDAFTYLGRMFGLAARSGIGDASLVQFMDNKTLLVFLLGLAFSTSLGRDFFPCLAPADVGRVGVRLKTASWIISGLLLALSAVLVTAEGYNPFIYFRF